MNAEITMTEAQARRLGYTLSSGSYYGTSDDVAGRWYWLNARDNRGLIDKRGRGHATKRAALEALAMDILETEGQ